ncbi:MAG TPA: menaquinone biosynthesis protein [Acidobacteriaceae bacterium]|nr:menaquinone biosynthesis protein [Acidobacteriaceae bacterium]
MTPKSNRLLRMAAIDFLNPAPLMWDFEHEPERSQLLERYTISRTTPAECALQLRSGEADLGLVPVASYAASPDLLIVPGCTVASLDRIRSILLVVRPADGIAAVRTVAADTSSQTSCVYTRILFDLFWKRRVEFIPSAPNLEEMLAAADAAMLIGDPALLALEDRESRQERTGERLLYLDLAHEWHMLTGLPWVSAYWAIRSDALARTGISPDRLIQDLHASRDHGLQHIEEIVAEWSVRIAVPSATIRSYLTANIHYTLDEACLHGLREFYRHAEACGALPAVQTLTFL